MTEIFRWYYPNISDSVQKPHFNFVQTGADGGTRTTKAAERKKTCQRLTGFLGFLSIRILIERSGDPNEVRTRVSAVKGQRKTQFIRVFGALSYGMGPLCTCYVLSEKVVLTLDQYHFSDEAWLTIFWSPSPPHFRVCHPYPLISARLSLMAVMHALKILVWWTIPSSSLGGSICDAASWIAFKASSNPASLPSS